MMNPAGCYDRHDAVKNLWENSHKKGRPHQRKEGTFMGEFGRAVLPVKEVLVQLYKFP